jgi:hypothetical protein
VNGDGIGDLLLGDEEGTVITTHEGIAYLVYGRRDFPERIAMPLDLGPVALEGVVRLANASLKQAGRALGATGDYNGDGYSDFTVGAVNLDFFEPWSIDVVFGGPELPPLLELRDLGHRGFSIEGIRPFTALDETTHAAGDLNGDGAPDFAFSEAPLPVAGDAEPSPGSVHVLFGLPPSVPFIRGDADDDGRLNITDGVFTLTFLFLGGIDPPCEDATDTDDRGTIELTDAVYVLNHLFLGGPAPPAPYPDAGVDPTEDRLGCLGY